MRRVVLSSDKGVVVGDVAPPTAGDNELLVSVHASVISAGTELMTLASATADPRRQLLRRPMEGARIVAAKVHEQGLASVLRKAVSPTESLSSLGYSCAGTVLEVGRSIRDLQPGARVACAGASHAHHAEIVAVPRLLACPVPESVALRDAAMTTIGAIALQGIRRAQCHVGEVVAVIGLGLIGQLALQIAKASGCRTLGVDLDEWRCELARDHGADITSTDASSAQKQALAMTSGHGVDAVVLCASSDDSDVANEALRLCRHRGRVAVVGAVPLDVDRSIMYARELDLVLSTSYGPGRYDTSYEEDGVDYPFGLVRWTENRNMAAFLDLMSRGLVRVDGLLSADYEVGEAPAAYEALSRHSRTLAVSLSYGRETSAALPRPREQGAGVPRKTASRNAVKVAVVGLGGFTLGTRLPLMVDMPDLFDLRAVVSSRSEVGLAVAEKFGAARALSDPHEAILDPEIDLLWVAGRHDNHAPLVVEAMHAGKAVFVEKPLCLTMTDLETIAEAAADSGAPLFVGFNRRYSPAAVALRRCRESSAAPSALTYRVAVGSVPQEHWTLDPAKGGGRILGEACHFVDLLMYVLGDGVPPFEMSVVAVGGGPVPVALGSFAATLKFANGSVGSVMYAMLGDCLSKERAELLIPGGALVVDDYRSAAAYGDACGPAKTVLGEGARKGEWRWKSQDKGWRSEMIQVAQALQGRDNTAITLAEGLEASRVTLVLEEYSRAGADSTLVSQAEACD